MNSDVMRKNEQNDLTLNICMVLLNTSALSIIGLSIWSAVKVVEHSSTIMTILNGSFLP